MPFILLKPVLIYGCLFTLLAVTLLYWTGLVFPDNKQSILLAKIGMIVTTIATMVHLMLRWFYLGHLPLSTLYDSLLFLVCSFTLSHMLVRNEAQSDWLGAVIAPSAMCIQAFVALALPQGMQQDTALVPALQSNWLLMHVSTMVLSYCALLLGSILSMILLIISSKAHWNSTIWHSMLARSRVISQHKTASGQAQLAYANHSLEWLFYEIRRERLLAQLDYWSYRAIGIGFLFLTVGILSGAVWANEAWGSYWSWDPKETWALISWLVFAAYLHTRMREGWAGTKPALVAFAGFWVVWICYLGVNLLERGLHSYGRFS